MFVLFSVCLTGVSAADFPDVPAGSDKYDAVKTLTDLGVIAGYEDGNFQPEREITRTEFAALLARTLGYSDAYTAVSLPFYDVPSGYWGEGVISFCYEKRLINGMGGGKFAPAQKVTCEQAVKMVVCAAGKEQDAAAAGGAEWFSGYVAVAEQCGFLNNVSFQAGANAKRGDIAQLVYNAKSSGMLTEVNLGTSQGDGESGDANEENSVTEKPSIFIPWHDAMLNSKSELGEIAAKDYSNVQTIVVDAGHNHDGMDLGARNDAYGIKEEDITWQIADKLRAKLTNMGYNVVMTRESIDSSIANTSTTDSLKARVDTAESISAELFVSIHCNAGGGKGTETYCFSTGGNAARLAELVQKNIKSQVGMLDRGVKTANFYVLKNTTMPAILIETGFIDSDSDVRVLTSEDGQNKIAAAVADAVAEYDGMR